MYRTTLKRSLRPFAKQLLPPLIASGILAIILYPVSELTINLNLIASLTLKGILFIAVVGGYIQLSNEYNLIGKIKTIIKRNK